MAVLSYIRQQTDIYIVFHTQYEAIRIIFMNAAERKQFLVDEDLTLSRFESHQGQLKCAEENL